MQKTACMSTYITQGAFNISIMLSCLGRQSMVFCLNKTINCQLDNSRNMQRTMAGAS